MDTHPVDGVLNQSKSDNAEQVEPKQQPKEEPKEA